MRLLAIGDAEIVLSNDKKQLVTCRLEDPEKVFTWNISNVMAVTADIYSNQIWLINEEGKLCLYTTEGKLKRELDDAPEQVAPLDSLTQLHILDEDRLLLRTMDRLYIFSTKNNTWIEYDDPTRSGMKENTRYLIKAIRNWDKKLETFVIIGDDGSSDIICGGIIEGEFKLFFLVIEEGLAQLPMNKEGCETHPIAMDIDYSSTEPVQSKPSDLDNSILLPPQPILWIMNTEGRLFPFRVVKNDSFGHPHPFIKKFHHDTQTKERDDVAYDANDNSDNSPAADDNNIDEIIQDEPLLPVISTLTEDFGLLNNAILSEAVDLINAFDQDLDQTRHFSDELYHKLLKGRSLIHELELKSDLLGSTSGKMDALLSVAVDGEYKLRKLIYEMDSLSLLNDKCDLVELIGKLSLAVEMTEKMISKVEQMENYNEKIKFMQCQLVPQLESAVSMIPSKSIKAYVPTIVRDKTKFSDLHARLRQCDPKSLVKYVDRRPVSKMKPALSPPPSLFAGLAPIPKPLTLATVPLELARIPERVKQVAPIFTTKVEEATDTSNFATRKVFESTGRQKGNEDTMPFSKPGKSTELSSLTSTEQKTREKVVSVIETTKSLSTGGSLQKIEVETPQSLQPEATKPFSFAFPAASPVISQQIEDLKLAKPIQTGSEKSVISQQELKKTELPGAFAPIASPQQSERSESPGILLDTASLDIKSPTPKGPKVPTSPTSTSSSSFSFGFNFNTTSLDKQTEEEKGKSSVQKSLLSLSSVQVSGDDSEWIKIEPQVKQKEETKTMSSIFALPQTISKSEFQPSIDPLVMSSGTFGFKPSPLATAIPQPQLSQNVQNIATVPQSASLGSFGSLQSIGATQSAFGQPTFGQTAFLSSGNPFTANTAGPTVFGQTSTLGTAGPSVPTSTGGFSAFANNTGNSGFAVFASKPPDASSIFGPASKDNKEDANKKSQLPPSFTQFRS